MINSFIQLESLAPFLRAYRAEQSASSQHTHAKHGCASSIEVPQGANARRIDRTQDVNEESIAWSLLRRYVVAPVARIFSQYRCMILQRRTRRNTLLLSSFQDILIAYQGSLDKIGDSGEAERSI